MIFKLRPSGLSFATWWPNLPFTFTEQVSGTTALGRATETDTVPTVRAVRLVPLGRAEESDVARDISHIRFFVLGRAEEINVANLVEATKPGLGLVTRYVTIELVDKNRRTRRNVHRDIITYSTSPTKVTFVHKAVTDKVRHSQHVDRIFFQKNL